MYPCLLDSGDSIIEVIKPLEDIGTVWLFVIGFWWLFYVIQMFLAYGTAYRCTKKGSDNGAALFIYLIGFSFAALIPGLGLHYYIKHLPPKQVIVRQTVQPSVVKIVEQAPPQEIYTQTMQAGYVPGQGQPIYMQQGQPVQPVQGQMAPQQYQQQMTPQQYQQAILQQQQQIAQQQQAAMNPQQVYNQNNSDNKK